MKALRFWRALQVLGLAYIPVAAGFCVYLAKRGDTTAAAVTVLGVFAGGLVFFLARIEARDARARLR